MARPKVVDDSPLPWRPPKGPRSEQFRYFCHRFIKVGKGGQKLTPLVLRDWQMDIARDILDSPSRLACLLIGRGNGKSSLLGALAAFDLFTYGESASIVICATNQEQAGIIFGIARRYIELAPELDSRCQIANEKIFIPHTNSSMVRLPADPKSLEGLDYSSCYLDECGVVSRDTYEVLLLAQGKRESSRLIAAGTPPTNPQDSVLTDLRNLHRELGDDAVVFRAFSADDFQHHPATCMHCAQLANPALGDFLHADALKLSRGTRENTYRRQRLCQFVEDNESPFVDAETWDALSTGQAIPAGTEVVLSVDASLKDDSTAIVLGTVEAKPHFDKLAVWEKPADGDGWRVDILAVEDAIRQASRRWKIREVVYDPAYFTRSAQVLAAEGLPMVEFSQNASRQTPATNDLHSAAINGLMSHSGDPDLRRHVLAATVRESDKGIRIAKVSRSKNAPKVDLAAALVFCHSRCSWLASRPKKRRHRVIGSR
ncbi:terminase large subunit domain-containing protein [Mycolicibacterium hodleri]|uniref:terminase large subunit domain-containing protein n=1 Tax=Mycolicibacterium hodleri TaxID=49897 RepID=UPI0027E2B5B3|nr:terminase large subunit [Mycolicibacterium hodleri]